MRQSISLGDICNETGDVAVYIFRGHCYGTGDAAIYILGDCF
jgi:hypothetical protein